METYRVTYKRVRCKCNKLGARLNQKPYTQNMKHLIIKYLLLVFLGVFWYFFAVIATRLFNLDFLTTRLWSIEVLFAIITSVSVGLIFYNSIIKSTGKNWYILPFKTIFAASLIFGSLFTLTREPPNNHWSWILAFVFYSLTYFILLFYPLALLTQYLIKYIINNFSGDLKN